MVPSIIDVWGYDRVLFVFFFFFFFSKLHNSKTKEHKVMKFCKNFPMGHTAGLVIHIILMNGFQWWSVGSQ